MNLLNLHGAGLGLRRELLDALETHVPAVIDFFEIAPENWIDMGGAQGRRLRPFTERYPFVCHGLSLSLGGPSALDESLLRKTRAFMDEHGIALFTEHLSYCSDDGHLYDLLPIPFTGEAVTYVAARIRRAQDILERQIAIENASFYVLADIAEMDEASFINAVLKEADCLLHLDVNNVYVNSINHQFDAHAFIRAMPAQRVVYMHTAGHYQQAPDLLVDTHGADVIEPVWALLDEAYHHAGTVPTLLERDFNIPPLEQLATEIARIAALQHDHQCSTAQLPHV
ncbi:MAG: HvfB family MNIO-type RiPP peptide maturase [Sulfuriferula sp.]